MNAPVLKPVLVQSDGWPDALDLRLLSAYAPEQPQSIMVGLPCGYATGWWGHGGVGKSAIALHLAVCMALEIPFFGVQLEGRRVAYLSCEDRERVLHWRLDRICAYEGIKLEALTPNLRILDLVGHDAVLWGRDPRTGNTVTPAFHRLAQRMKDYGTEVLIVDGISDSFDANENSRADVKRYVNALVSLIPPDRGAVLLIGHVDKQTAKGIETTQGYSGSTGWSNSVRARWYLRPESVSSEDGERAEPTGDLMLELQKSNLGKSGLEMRFTWNADAHLFEGRTVSGTTHFDQVHRDRTEQDGILRALAGCADAGLHVPAAMQGPNTAALALSLRPEFPESLKGAGRPKKHRFRRHIETLRQLRYLRESSYRRENRHVVSTITITDEGRAQCA